MHDVGAAVPSRTVGPWRFALQAVWNALESECAPYCGSCCANDNPLYVSRKDGWLHPLTSPDRGATSTVVLVGGSGVGKSNLGNFILGRVVFESRNFEDSITAVPQVEEGNWFNGLVGVRVVDCTGSGDTKGEPADQEQWERTLRLLKKVRAVNTVILVMKAGRFTQTERNVITKLRVSFGPILWRHLLVFFTGAAAKPSQLSLQEVVLNTRSILWKIETQADDASPVWQDVEAIPVYGADLDPVLCSEDARRRELRLKRALRDLSLEELLEIDRRIPYNLMELTDSDIANYAARGPASEAWIQGNYFQLGLSRLLNLKQAVENMETLSFGAPDHTTGMEEAVASSRVLEKTPSFSCATNAIAGSPDPRVGYLRRALLEADMVMVRGPWVDRVQSQGVLPSREDLLSEAIWDAEISYSKGGRKFYLV